MPRNSTDRVRPYRVSVLYLRTVRAWLPVRPTQPWSYRLPAASDPDYRSTVTLSQCRAYEEGRRTK